MKAQKIQIGEYTITLSPGNKKMGNVMSLSVTPGITCPTGIPCYNQGCYARRMAEFRPAIAKTWEENRKAIENCDNDELALKIADVIRKKEIKLFRFNVGGDFGIDGYWAMAYKIARMCPDTLFYAYTKFYVLANRKRPANFNLILSAWGDVKPNTENAAICYVDDGKTDIPADAHRCAGDCENCMVCAMARPGQHIVIKKH